MGKYRIPSLKKRIKNRRDPILLPIRSEEISYSPPVVSRKKVLSYSLFELPNDNGRAFGFYHRSALAVIKAARNIFPDWIIRIHHDNSWFKLPFAEALKNIPEIELRHVASRPQALGSSMLWRLLPCWDPEVEIVACRDMDSLPLVRDRIMLDAFIESGAATHSLSDNVQHSIPLLGGMCAFRTSTPACKQLFGETTQPELINAHPHAWDEHGSDQLFLNSVIWPRLRKNSLVHKLMSKPIQSPLPTDLPEGLTLASDSELAKHIGQAGFDIAKAENFHDHFINASIIKSLTSQEEQGTVRP